MFVYERDYYNNVSLVGSSAYYDIYGQSADNPVFAWAAISVPHGGWWDFRLAVTEYATGDTTGYLEYGDPCAEFCRPCNGDCPW